MNADRQAWIDRARAVRIEDELAQRGIRLRGAGVHRNGPCPLCGGDDRFSINTTKQVFRCRECNDKGGDVITMVGWLDGCDFNESIRTLTGELSAANYRMAPAAAVSPAVDHDTYARQQARKAGWLWEHRQPIGGSIAERYLRETRGYGGPLPTSLGFLPARGEHPPAMIAAFWLASDDDSEPRNVHAVHLTKLASDGSGKAAVEKPKICIGRPAARPITVAPITDLLALAITEGIEDGLSVAWATGVGVWAAGAAGFMPPLADAVPSYVECATIYAHADQAGRRGALDLADRLVARGIETFVEGL